MSPRSCALRFPVYITKYCQFHPQKGFIEVRPDLAAVFRVFTAGTEKRHIKDFLALSEVNDWIEAARKKDEEALKRYPQSIKKIAIDEPSRKSAKTYSENLYDRVNFAQGVLP